ncbi:MAG: hypothetical protein AAGG48_22030 [Planctomycetota bacterium]
MQTIQRLSHATPDTIRGELLTAVEYLMRQVRRRVEVLDEISAVQSLLESLPLTTDTYGAAVNRLTNAHRYLLSREFGAAGYELKLLAGGLQSEGRVPARKHHRFSSPFKPVFR